MKKNRIAKMDTQDILKLLTKENAHLWRLEKLVKSKMVVDKYTLCFDECENLLMWYKN